MSNNLFNSNDYVTFDATSMRDLIINRLNQGQVFTDQNYQGSNFSALIDVVSYTVNTLLFYLNKTSSESMFSDAQIYENMNRIVKLLNYKPVGRLTQNVPFELAANSNISPGNYIIPRYSYINVGGTTYSFNTDINFTKVSTGVEVLADITNNYLLYQGKFIEYPIYIAGGIDNEVINLSLNDTTYVDHFNIHVYVLPQGSSTWTRWALVPELFLQGSSDAAFETRFNENKKYEIKFGDDINGKKLNAGDQVAIYYLNIDPLASGISANTLQSSFITPFNSVHFFSITEQNYIDPSLLKNLTLSNSFPSTSYSPEESVDSIRQNAPKGFRSQYRLVTVPDYENYTKTNFSNIVQDVKVLSNDDYLKSHLKYLYDIGLNNPQLDNRVLYNQIKFANSCNFNNLYVYVVPVNENQTYLSSSQKELVVDGLQNSKTITSQIVPIDPVYIYLDFYVATTGIIPSVADSKNCVLQVVKSANSRRANSSILNDVQIILTNTFSRSVNTLGQLIDLHQLSVNLLNIDGVQKIQTVRLDTGDAVSGVSLLFWNNVYPTQDVSVHNQNIQLESFKYPIFNNINAVSNRIQIVDNVSSIKTAEF